MLAFRLIVFVGLLLIVESAVASGSHNSTLERLLRVKLLSPTVYDPSTRSEDVIHVSVAFHLLTIEELDISYQKMTMTGYFEFEWYDQRLSWNHSEHGNIKYIFSKQDEIWFPELIIDNSVAGFNVIFNEHLQIRIKHNGQILWEPPLIFYTHCEVDITFYPFDQQKCGISLASWGYHEDEVFLTHHLNHIVMEDFKENGEWIVMRTNTESHHLADTVDGVTHFFPQLDFNVFIRRRPTFYILNRILPVTFASFLVLIVFLLPAESGEKVSYALTELLALAFLLTLLTNYLPSTSLTASVLGLYLAFTLSLSTLATIATVIILWLYHRTGNMATGTCFAKLTKWIAKHVGCIKGCKKDDKATALKARLSPDIAVTSVEADEIYSYREVSIIWDKACFRAFLCLTVLSTVVFMTVLAAGGEIYGVK